MSKPKPATFGVKLYNIVEEKIEVGVRAGYRHAHKHNDTPDDETIIEHITRDVMNELCEVIDFDSGE